MLQKESEDVIVLIFAPKIINEMNSTITYYVEKSEE